MKILHTAQDKAAPVVPFRPFDLYNHEPLPQPSRLCTPPPSRGNALHRKLPRPSTGGCHQSRRHAERAGHESFHVREMWTVSMDKATSGLYLWYTLLPGIHTRVGLSQPVQVLRDAAAHRGTLRAMLRGVQTNTTSTLGKPSNGQVRADVEA